MSGTPYSEQAPAPEWRAWVECGWCAETGDGRERFDVRPDGCLDIVYSPPEGLRVVGTMTVERSFTFASGTRVAGVRFQPGMAGSCLGVAPVELTDALVPLEDIWGSGARILEARLDAARSPGETMRILLGAVPPPAKSPSPVQRAIAAIARDRGVCDLERAAVEANLSPRQFRRRCELETGLAPKLLTRVLRFRRACELAAQSAAPRWSEIAAEAGYFDQAHLIRDFHEFAGRSPMAVFSNTAGSSAE